MQQIRKKCYSLWNKGENITYKLKREKEETKAVKDLLKKLNSKKMWKQGPYLEDRTRPMKIKLKSQITREILERTSKLREVEDCKDIYIKKNLNEEEWKKLKKCMKRLKGKINQEQKKKRLYFFLEFCETVK